MNVAGSGLPSANAHIEQRQVDGRMDERDDLEAAERDHLASSARASSAPIRRSGSSASRGPPLDLRGPPGELVVLVVGDDGRRRRGATPARPAGPGRLGSSTSASTLSRSGSTDHSSSKLAAHRPGRVLAELDRAARAERPAPGPRRQPGGSPPRQPRAVGGPDQAQDRQAPGGVVPGSAAAPSATGWSSSDRRPGPDWKPAIRAASPSCDGEPRRRRASSATSAASVTAGRRAELVLSARSPRPPSGSHGPRARMPGACATAYTVLAPTAESPRRSRLAAGGAAAEALGMGIRGRAALGRGAAAARRRSCAARLGFGSLEPAQPVPLADVSLPAPRLRPPGSLEPICRSDTYERALHAYGRSYSDIVRAFRGRFDHPPGRRRPPARRGRDRGGARVGDRRRRGGDPVRRRHERRRRRRGRGPRALRGRRDAST